jgi:hypothetical protein
MSDHSPAAVPPIHVSAFLRTLIAPLIVWGAAVFSITAVGQPGVVCVTPMAWLLALWCGRRYVQLSDGQPDRFGPALLGAALGLCLGLIFVLVSAQAIPVDPSDVSKSQTLTAIMIAGGILVCAALSMFAARATLRQYSDRRA